MTRGDLVVYEDVHRPERRSPLPGRTYVVTDLVLDHEPPMAAVNEPTDHGGREFRVAYLDQLRVTGHVDA